MDLYPPLAVDHVTRRFPAPTADAATPAIESTPTSAAPTPEQLERAKKQAALDYATMEDSYLNDAHGQWAKEVTATSTFGDTNSGGPSDVNKPKNIVGNPDSRGPRQWFVRKVEKTAALVNGVKITFANAVDRGYKTVDAVQLVGE